MLMSTYSTVALQRRATDPAKTPLVDDTAGSVYAAATLASIILTGEHRCDLGVAK